MPEKPCEWAENPSGSVWECNAHNTQCAHKHADTNPDGSVNIFECQLGDPAYAFREIKRLQRLTQSYQETVDRLVGVLQERWIPVEEIKPVAPEPVLIWYEYFHFSADKILPEYGIGRYFPQLKQWGGDAGSGSKVRVIAWQPLPEPPKGDTHV